MSYETLFRRYGSPSKEAEIRITAYLIRPDTLTADRIPFGSRFGSPKSQGEKRNKRKAKPPEI